MQKQIKELIGASPFKVHVAVEGYRRNSVLFNERERDVFSSASVIKVPILIAVLHHLQETNGNLQQMIDITPQNQVDFSVLTEQKRTSATLEELLTWMTITSDNTATNVCIDFLGMDGFNTYFQVIGLTQTRVQRKMMDFERQQQGFDNETTAGDMQHLFKQIYEGTLLTPKWNEVALGILCRQRSHESLRRYIIEDVKIAHKTGGLETVDHDVGIFFMEHGAYFIGVFVTEVTDNEQAKCLIGAISKIVYDQFNTTRGELV